MNRQPDFLKNAPIKSSHIHLYKFDGAEKFREIEEDIRVVLSYQVNDAFCCTKSLYEMKN